MVELRIAHLYADLMNIYGDFGNIIALRRRCEWRGITAVVHQVSIGDKIDPAYYDFYFFGGGQDWQQNVVAEDLKGQKTPDLLAAKANKAVFLAICGGYQLLGQYYQPFAGEKLIGAGIFDAYTRASSKRMIQNLVTELDFKIVQTLSPISPESPLTLVGFENHSGQTFLGPNARPLGKVLIGDGNNGEDKTEGAIDGTAFGCYLHGSLLPKNPHFADYLLSLALKRRYGDMELQKLDNTIEYKAHQNAISRAKQVK